MAKVQTMPLLSDLRGV